MSETPVDSGTMPAAKIDDKVAEPIVEAPAEAAADAVAAAESGESGEAGDAKTDAEGPSETTETDNKESATKDPAANGSQPKAIKTNKPSNKKNNLPVSDNADDIREQVEWYFGDVNLPQDEHMWVTTGGPENKPVALSHICSFGRMLHFQPYSAVIEALRESKTLDVSGEAGKEEIKRKEPYVIQTRPPNDRINRTVYAKGFGEEDGLLTQVEIERFFKQYGRVNLVKLRRVDDTGEFKGSVFTEFATAEDAANFMQLDPKPTYKGEELVTMMKKEYTDMKSKMIEEGKMEPGKKGPASQFWEGHRSGNRKHHNRRGNGRDREGGDRFDWKHRRDHKNAYRAGRGGARGGRGRGGNRGGNSNAGDHASQQTVTANGNTLPVIKATEEVKKSPKATTNGKRAREDDGEARAERSAKKADTALDAENPAPSSKRAREADGEGNGEGEGEGEGERPAKKVDAKADAAAAA